MDIHSSGDSLLSLSLSPSFRDWNRSVAAASIAYTRPAHADVQQRLCTRLWKTSKNCAARLNKSNARDLMAKLRKRRKKHIYIPCHGRCDALVWIFRERERETPTGLPSNRAASFAGTARQLPSPVALYCERGNARSSSVSTEEVCCPRA